MSIDNLTYLEALDELTVLLEHPETITKAVLESLVERVSVRDPVAGANATTYLYSGGLCEGYSTHDLISVIDQTEGYRARIIDRTDAAKFLESTDYKNALRTALVNENPVLALPENDGQLKEAVNNYLYDSTNGPWANRSAEFVETASGNVECLVPNAQSGRVWWETEFPQLLNNPNVQSVNGTPIEDLLSTKDNFINELG